ncbi:MAG: hypothetical protein RR708_04845 [Bacilli bacterium]
MSGLIYGLLAGYLIFNEDGKKALNKITNFVGKGAEKIVKAGVDTIKEVIPETTKIFESDKNEAKTDTTAKE